MGSALMDFWGLRVPPGQQLEVAVDESRIEMIHVGKVALGPKPGTTPHCVLISDAAHSDIAVCTLDKNKRQTSVEFVITRPTVFSHTGDSDVYFSGFKSYGGLEEDEDEDEEPLAAANGLPMANGRAKLAAAAGQARAGGKLGQFFVPEHLTDEDEPNASDELRDVELDSDDMVGTFTDGGDEDEDEDDESYDDEDEEVSDDDMLLDDELGEEGGSEEGDEDEDKDEDEEAEEAAPPATGSKKRPAEAPASTPVAKKQAVPVKEAPGTAPAKVAVKSDAKTPKSDVKTPKPDQKTPKADSKTPKPDQKMPKSDAKTSKPDQKTPKSDAKTPKPDQKTPKPDQKTPKSDQKTPKGDQAPKTPATPATPGTIPEYVAALKEALKGGPLPLAQVGSAVKKPKEVQKLKAFFLQHAATFAISSDDKVSLK